MFDYQKSNRFFAQAPGETEEFCEEELAELGATETQKVYRGVYFNADKETLYKINYTSRLISRVLAPLINYPCYGTNDLMKIAKKVAWEEIFSIDQTFAITSAVTNSKITNSLYAAQCLKDGIADYFRAKFGKRPSVNVSNPDVRFHLFIEKGKAIVSLDTSGESLHKRGYRLKAGEAPMQESLAAAIIRISTWNGETPLWDCMCGSGTILCEALMHYCRIPAQKLRENFGLFYLPDFDKSIWQKVKEQFDLLMRPLPKGLIIGSDKSQRAIEVAKENLSRLPFGDAVEINCHPFQHVDKFEDGTIITNPPYGIRLSNTEEVKILFKELGDFLKTSCNGTSAFIYSGDPALRKSIGLRTSRRIPLVNGKLKGVLFQIDSYKGSKKSKYNSES